MTRIKRLLQALGIGALVSTIALNSGQAAPDKPTVSISRHSREGGNPA